MEIEEKYNESINYIYSFINYSLTKNLRYSAEKFDISRMYKLMSFMDNPQDNYDVIHVAGTKGKGSICAMTASILKTAGYQVGFYSSPHMIDLRERIRINDKEISKQEFVTCVEELKPIFSKVEKVSTFEIITAIAFKHFSDKEVDIAVIEVGMGGRLDATNVVHPLVSIISPISIDHTKILGNTIEKIAAEKAGIIKKHVPVFLSPQNNKAKRVFDAIAKEQNSEIIYVEDHYEFEILKHTLLKQSFVISWKGPLENKTKPIRITIPLLGDHQVQNAVTAYACVRQMIQYGYKISKGNIKKGFSNINWPGRFEVIHNDPLIIIDGAHNVDSFQKLKSTIKKYIPDKSITLIFGVSEDKDVVSMLRIIRSDVNKYIFTKSTHPRAVGIDELAKIARKMNLKKYSLIDIDDILPYIMEEGDLDSAYIASGSIFIAGAIKQNLYNNNL